MHSSLSGSQTFHACYDNNTFTWDAPVRLLRRPRSPTWPTVWHLSSASQVRLRPTGRAGSVWEGHP